MKLINIFKKGFSLTELLIVLVIIAVLFAALAPIFTKRSLGTDSANESVWNFVNGAKDAYFDPGVESYTSAAYFGFNPNKITDPKLYAKVYIRAKEDQNHIQFRYGDSYGNLTGLFSMDNKGNTITSTRPASTNYTFTDRGSNNTIAGTSAYTTWTGSVSMIGIGASALSTPGGEELSANTTVGANTGQYLNGSHNTLIGANTGRGKGNIYNTVAVGARILSIDESAGNNNVFLGYGVATAGFNSDSAKQNTIIASNMYGTTSHNNTIIGYSVYDANFGPSYNITAAGYNACSSIDMTTGLTNSIGPKTCIGYRSADTMGTSGMETPNSWATDTYEHVFIGGAPYGFNGRSVLEVHNMDSNEAGSGSWSPNIAPTVVLNSHLVVRGNLFFPSVTSNDVMAHDSVFSFIPDGTVKGHDRCGRNCLETGRKKFRGSKKCKTFNELGMYLFDGLIAALTLVFAAYSIGAILVADVVAAGVWGGILGTALTEAFMTFDHDFNAARNPATASAMSFYPNNSSYKCGTNTYYPTNTNYCPNLQLSDLRLKENITENTDALDKIMYVMPYNYTYKKDSAQTPQVGVTAQDLKKYLPDSVTADEQGYLSIKWDGIFYAVINSLKELDAQTAGAETDISSMENDAAELAKEQKSAQKRIDELNKRIKKLEVKR